MLLPTVKCKWWYAVCIGDGAGPHSSCGRAFCSDQVPHAVIKCRMQCPKKAGAGQCTLPCAFTLLLPLICRGSAAERCVPHHRRTRQQRWVTRDRPAGGSCACASGSAMAYPLQQRPALTPLMSNSPHLHTHTRPSSPLAAAVPTAVATVSLVPHADPQVELTNTEDGKHGHLSFRAKKGEDGEYELDLDLYAGVDKDKSKINITPRSIFMVLEKVDPESWPRLTKEPSK